MKRRNPRDLVSDIQQVSVDALLSQAKNKEESWKKLYGDSLKMLVEADRQLDAMLAIQGEPANLRFEKLKKSKSRGVAVIVPATDWHVEERIESAAVNGKNRFNLAEAESRIRRFYGKVLELIDWQGHLAPVVELWHPLLGDLMSGYIHEELMESNSLSPTEACVFLQEMICSGIDLWLKKTRLPIFIPTCVGNHGRTTPKKRIKTSCKNSYEWLLYMTMAKRYEKNRRVAWHVGQGYHNTQTIMGRKVRFHHGDGLRYMGGVGGITIPVNKSIAQWDKAQAADLDVFGHYHQFVWGYNKWVACGSLAGYSEFSVEIKADFQHPSQTFIVLDRNYGVTCAAPIFLTKPARSA